MTYNRRRTTVTVASTLAASVLLTTLAGCGGSGGGKNASPTTSASNTNRAAMGMVRISIAWPEETAASRLIPVGTRSIRVRLRNDARGDVILPSNPGDVLKRSDDAVSPVTESYLVPADTYELTAFSYTSDDGSGTPTASGRATVIVGPATIDAATGQPTTGSITNATLELTTGLNTLIIDSVDPATGQVAQAVSSPLTLDATDKPLPSGTPKAQDFAVVTGAKSAMQLFARGLSVTDFDNDPTNDLTVPLEGTNRNRLNWFEADSAGNKVSDTPATFNFIYPNGTDEKQGVLVVARASTTNKKVYIAATYTSNNVTYKTKPLEIVVKPSIKSASAITVGPKNPLDQNQQATVSVAAVGFGSEDTVTFTASSSTPNASNLFLNGPSPFITTNGNTSIVFAVPVHKGAVTIENVTFDVTASLNGETGSQQLRKLTNATKVNKVDISIAANGTVTGDGNGTYIVAAGQSRQFTATVTGIANSGVTWAANDGSVSPPNQTTTLYTAPKKSGTFTLTATDNVSGKTTSVTIKVPGGTVPVKIH